MFREWRDRGLFESTEQCVCDQARAIRKDGWLSQLELEVIKRQVEDEFQVEFGENATTKVETENEDTAENEAMVENETESIAEEIVNVEEVNNNVIDSVDDTRHTLNHEHRKIVERLNEIMLEGKTSDGIMFKKVDKKTLKVQTDTRDLKGELGSKKKQKMKELYEKYKVKRKRLKTVIDELKQRMLAKSAKVKRYEQRIEQFRQNTIFDLGQKQIYAELNGNGIKLNDVPNAEKSAKFWGDIWVSERSITERQKG